MPRSCVESGAVGGDGDSMLGECSSFGGGVEDGGRGERAVRCAYGDGASSGDWLRIGASGHDGCPLRVWWLGEEGHGFSGG